MGVWTAWTGELKQARAALLAGTALAGMAAGLPPAAFGAEATPLSAQAGAAAVAFDIPAGPLPAALAIFGERSGLTLLYPAELARGRLGKGVSGTLTPETALSRLLQGSGLTYRFTGAGTVTLVETLPSGSLHLDPVSVEGARGVGTESGWAEPARIVVGARDLERKNPTDLRQIFAGEAGIKVGGSIPMSEKLYVNGIEETNLAVSIDGGRQNNKVFHHSGTTLIDPSFLKVARVDAGVAPADAGPGALAGAVAYETKDARDFLEEDGVGGMAKTSYNLNGASSVNNLGGYARHGWAEGLVNLTYGKGGKFEDGNGEKVRGSEVDTTSGLLKLAAQTTGGGRLSLGFERVYDNSTRPYRGNMGNLSGRPAWEPKERAYVMDRRNWTAAFSDSAPTDWWNPKVVLAHGSTEINLPIYNAATNYPGRGVTRSLNGKAENTFTTPMGAVTVGTDFYNDKAFYEDQTFYAAERARNHGVYAQARLQPLEPVKLSFGLRGDWQTFVGTRDQEWDNSGWSPNVSGEVQVIPGRLKAKSGYSHTWAGVPLAENFIMNTAWTYATAPVPVTADNLSAGLEASQWGFTLDWRIFRTRIDEARTAKYAVASGTLTRDVRSRGNEFGLAYAWTDGFARARYADIDVAIDGTIADSDTGTYLATPMGKILTLAAAHTVRPWSSTFGGDLEVVLDSDKTVPGSRPMKGYRVVNLFGEHQLTDIVGAPTLRMDVRNLFDQLYVDRATYGQEYATVTPLYQPGRSILFSVTARF